jgi:hypothetical protein
MQETDSQGQVEAQEEAGCNPDCEENESPKTALTDRVRVSWDISRAHQRKLKVYAAQHGITLNAAVEESVNRLCDN